ncbi:TIGR03086 family metal-binding protein [Nocardia sp. NPDC052278]|uniref:TIGR03086 family metal-binding protein n=1 Tax=unclassified Nocardia TaxID=2637762 RepID=UPI003685B6E7
MHPASDELSLLGSATRYFFQSILLVRGADLSAPTPCSDWNLDQLLRHVGVTLGYLTDVLAAQGREAADVSEPEADPSADPVAVLRGRIVDLLVAWTSIPETDRWSHVADRLLPRKIVAHVAAIEMVLHAWDIAQACKVDRPIPADLASVLLRVSPGLVEAGVADHAFGKPLEFSMTAAPGERLLALFGRQGRLR